MMDGAPSFRSDGSFLLSFFYRLRGRGLKVTPDQWLAVVRGLCLGLHGSSLIGFYSLARSILAKDESELDDFDQAFAAHFQGREEEISTIEQEVWRWLQDPISPLPMDPEWRRLLDQVDVEALRQEFEKRLAEQTERHDGGGRRVGTGGTSPFGHSGYHPGGIRVGGHGRLGSAVQVAAERRFREHRRDLVLDTRQFGVALKKLRALKRIGPADELDIEESISSTAREGGELCLVFRPPRANRLDLLLAMDVGGSMEPHRDLVDVLFSAAHSATHFHRFEHLYFHNCFYGKFYADSWFRNEVTLHDLVRRFGRETRLVMVGDAHMYPGELTERGGSINYWERNEESGLAHLKRLRETWPRTAWLNPLETRFWGSPSTRMIRALFPMHPLSVEGVETLARDLAKGA